MITFQNFTELFAHSKTFSLMRYHGGSALHFHSALELVYFIDGELEIAVNGNVISTKKDDLVLINSSIVHGFSAIKKPLDYYVLIVSDEFLKSNGLLTEHTLYNNIIESKEIKELFKKMILEYERGDKFSNLSIISKIIDVFVILNRELKRDKSNAIYVDVKKLSIVKSALGFLNENYKEKLSIDEISQHLNYSKSYLSHAFKEITGYSIIEYLNVIRCQNARALLNKGCSVSETAYECGFAELSYFTRIFKKVTGITPSLARKERVTLFNHTELN